MPTNPENSFANVQSPNDFVLREHFEDFALLHDDKPYITLPIMTRAFGRLVNGKNGYKGLFTWTARQPSGFSWKQIGEPRPEPGIEIARREDIGIAPYQRKRIGYSTGIILANYCIKAETIPYAVNTMDTSGKTEEALHDFASELERQLSSTLTSS